MTVVQSDYHCPDTGIGLPMPDNEALTTVVNDVSATLKAWLDERTRERMAISNYVTSMPKGKQGKAWIKIAVARYFREKA